MKSAKVVTKKCQILDTSPFLIICCQPSNTEMSNSSIPSLLPKQELALMVLQEIQTITYLGTCSYITSDGRESHDRSFLQNPSAEALENPIAPGLVANSYKPDQSSFLLQNRCPLHERQKGPRMRSACRHDTCSLCGITRHVAVA